MTTPLDRGPEAARARRRLDSIDRAVPRLPAPVRNAEVVPGRPALTLHQKLHALRPHLAKAAQKVYDEWDASDPELGDVEVGFGGICQDVADAMSGVLHAHGVDHHVSDSNGMGEQHVWVTAHDPTHAYAVDIHPHHYETGGGYNWQKIPGVKFTADHVSVDPVDRRDLDLNDNRRAPVRNALTPAQSRALVKSDPMSQAAERESASVAHKSPGHPALREQAAKEHESAATAHLVAADRHVGDLDSPHGEAYHRGRAAYHAATAAYLRSGANRSVEGAFHLPAGDHGEDVWGRIADDHRLQEATASADERAYHEIRHAIPGARPRDQSGTNDDVPHAPDWTGTVDAPPREVHDDLTKVGFRRGRNAGYGTEYIHPDTGHLMVVDSTENYTGDPNDGGRTSFLYHPSYDPEHYTTDNHTPPPAPPPPTGNARKPRTAMADAAYAASRRATRASADAGKAGTDDALREAAAYHWEAATAHLIARDEAEELTPGAGARHVEHAEHHRRVVTNARDAAAAQAKRVQQLLATTGAANLQNPADDHVLRRREGHYAAAAAVHVKRAESNRSIARDDRRHGGAGMADVAAGHERLAKAHDAAAEAMRVADQTPHGGSGVSAFAHDASRAAGHGETPPPSREEAARLAGLHSTARLAHSIAADDAQDAGDAARELHHRYHEARHADRERYMTAWSAPEGTRTERGMFKAAGGVVGRGGYGGHQAVSAAADHRAYSEAYGLVPKLEVESIGEGVDGGPTSPAVDGHSTAPLAEIHKSLLAAGYSKRKYPHSDGLAHDYEHPAGHWVSVESGPVVGDEGREVSYKPSYPPQEYDTSETRRL